MPRFVPIAFVSSTSLDLEDYRQALIAAFPGLDVLFRGMEYFGSRPRRPKEVMLQELRECDLYLGIIAHRYGSIDDETGWSFTELEYREAVRVGLPTIFFLIDPSYPVDPNTIERDQAKVAKLERFKREVQTLYTTVTFTTRDDLANKAAEAIRKWTSEQVARWKAMERAAQPLSQREKQFIIELYDRKLVGQAIEALKNLQSSAALEHFLSLLMRGRNTPPSIKDAIVKALDGYKEIDRAFDVLIAAADADDHNIRRSAAFSIGEWAMLRRSVPDDAVKALRRRASDEVPWVRRATAHALGKLGRSHRDFAQQCEEILNQLQEDADSDVRGQAASSLRSLQYARTKND